MTLRFWRKWSLRAIAIDQLDLGTRQRVRMLLRRRRHPWPQLAVSLGSLGVFFLPLHVSIGPFSSAETGSEFLNTQWLVVAAVLGLAVAVVGIVMTAFLASQSNTTGLTLREFATHVGYTYILYAGILAILLNGMALFPLGTDAPAGWPGLWATAVSVAAVVGLIVVFERAIDALEPRRLARARTKRLVRETEAVVDTQLLRLSAVVWISDQASNGVAHVLTPPDGTAVIRASRSGRVTDIRIHKLQKLATAATADTTVWLVGETLLEHQVARETPLAAIPAQLEPAANTVRRTFRTSSSRPPADQELISTLEGLHQQAVQAIQIGDLTQWRAISQGYEDVLLAFPRARADSDLQIPLDDLLASSFLPTGPVDRIVQWLINEAQVALDSGHRDVSLALSTFPLRVARAANRLAAPTIVGRMVNLYPLLYQMAATHE